MKRFPVDVPKRKVIRALEDLGFRVVREKEHISMVRESPNGTKTPLTMPNHPRIKASTLRTICTQAGISREEFLEAYRRVIEA
jgi:predicted RNA binding protein YcfA (HicA-like mRNA interferase family)